MKMTLEVLIAAAKSFGPAAAMVGFFIWRDWKREDRMSKRMDANEDFIKTSLTGIIGQTTAAINNQTASNRELANILNRRPCLVKEDIKVGS